ncbi:mannosyl oligosaccharide glucosidase (macronuclear) [Tetrahymena thermophila SB210]|uniref:Mannosyl oligosaccharide glucosidase n=1 Tax=Tetrahymena thermophila (strain SB210) TaxID=312017 RepID=Q22HL0_TETTS|nr:mannosyl oligosaccharide glucosidase [Tetrahymena thermophila SB210]EAR84691.2 mannosyl oligosaccharide glucosidase [Tetrahymena thermophila SB210]|eukprot:XP_001032354.2 mannosyl oligosaccharide glucosidase [Tetrahymena thermophila SB210]
MNEFDKQKFLDQVKDVFQKKSRNSKDKQLIREFFRSYSEWEFWEKITKNSDKLLDLLAEKFKLVEFEQDTPIQVSQSQQEKNVIVLVQGSIEIKYEAQNPNYMIDNEQINQPQEYYDPEESLNYSEKDQRQKQKNNKKNTQSNKAYKTVKEEIKQEVSELLYDKGYKFQHYSAEDLQYVDVNMMYSNRKRVNQLTFQNSIKTLRQKIINEDDEFYFQPPQFFNSFGQGETYLEQPNVITFSTDCKSGFVLNKYLFKIRDIDYDDLSYYALTDISFLTLDIESLQQFLLERFSYLQTYDTFLENLFSQEKIVFSEQDIEKIKDLYVLQENIKQGDKMINTSQQQELLKFYIIKEGFFELQVQQSKNRHIKVQNQYNFIGNQINQKQIITVQNKKEATEFKTVAILQKGETFGEEIVFSSKKQYKFSVCKKTPYSEVLEFKFTNKNHIPEIILKYIQQQYNKKLELIDSDDDEENDLQDSITSKYNQQVEKQYQKKVAFQGQKCNNFNNNVKLNQSCFNSSNENEVKQESQSMVKKIVVNEFLLESLNQNNLNKNKSMFENQSQIIFDQKIRPNTGKTNQRIRFKSSEEEKQNFQSINEQKGENAYSPIPLVIQNFRKNQFVKKAMKLDQSTLSYNAKQREQSEKLQMMNYFPPIHAVYKKMDIEFSKSFDKNNFTADSNQDNQNIQQTEIAHQRQVKTVKLKLDQIQDDNQDLDEKSQSSYSLKEKYNSNQLIPARKIQSSNSARRHRGEIQIQKVSNKLNETNENQKLDTQTNDFKEQNLENIKNEYFRNLILNSVSQNKELIFFKENQTPEVSRVINYGLKGSKIRRTSPIDKQKRDESLKKSLLIKFMYQIEHDKWLHEQEIKNQILSQIDNNSSSTHKQKYVQSSQDDIKNNTFYIKSQSSSLRNLQQKNSTKNMSSLKINTLESKDNKYLSDNQLAQRPHSASKFQAETQATDSQKSLNLTTIINNKSGCASTINEKSKTTNSFYSHSNKQIKLNNFENDRNNLKSSSQKQRSLDRDIPNQKVTEIKLQNKNILNKEQIKCTSPRMDSSYSSNKNQTFQKQKKHFENNSENKINKFQFQENNSNEKLQTVFYPEKPLNKQKFKSSENQRQDKSSLSKDKNIKTTQHIDKFIQFSPNHKQNLPQKVKINVNNFKRYQSEQNLNGKQESFIQKNQLKTIKQKKGISDPNQIDQKIPKNSKKQIVDEKRLENSQDKIKKESNILLNREKLTKGLKKQEYSNEQTDNQVKKAQKEVKVTNEQLKNIKHIKNEKSIESNNQRIVKTKEKSVSKSPNKNSNLEVQSSKKRENQSKTQKNSNGQVIDLQQNNQSNKKIKKLQKAEEMKKIYKNESQLDKKQKQSQQKEKSVQLKKNLQKNGEHERNSSQSSSKKDSEDESNLEKKQSENKDEQPPKQKNLSKQKQIQSNSEMQHQSESKSQNLVEQQKDQSLTTSIKIVISQAADDKILNTQKNGNNLKQIKNLTEIQENQSSVINDDTPKQNRQKIKQKQIKGQDSESKHEEDQNEQIHSEIIEKKAIKKKLNNEQIQQSENIEKQKVAEEFTVKKIIRKNKFKQDD